MMKKKNKRGMGSMWGIVMAILTVMVLFFGTYNYVDNNYQSANVSLPINYTDSYDNLQEAEYSLNNSIENLKGAARNISEAEGDAVAVAWNGLTGIAYTIRLFFGIIGIAINVWQALFPGLAFLPAWIIILVEMAIIITLVLVILGLFKGESKTT